MVLHDKGHNYTSELGGTKLPDVKVYYKQYILPNFPVALTVNT